MTPQREPKATDFQLPVPGIGTFVFAKRSMGDEIMIVREHADIIGGVPPTPELAALANWFSVLRVLTVKAPDGWDLDEFDPLDTETYTKLRKVYTALREKEDSFRGGSGPAGEGSGA